MIKSEVVKKSYEFTKQILNEEVIYLFIYLFIY